MKPRVLMIAYACDPVGTGEHWLGWGWAEQAAKNYEVELLTRPHGGQRLAEAAAKNGIVLHTVAVPKWWWKLTQPLGSLGSWLRIYSWQKQALRVAENRHRERPFALVHQTTFHSFRAPFLAVRLGVPSVWGPIAGGESSPPGFGKFLGGSRYAEMLRHFINKFCISLPVIRESLRKSHTLIVSNRTTLNFLPKYLHDRAVIMPANAVAGESADAPPPRIEDHIFTILYAGNCVARRGISLALQALAAANLSDYHFYVAGQGPALARWKREAVQLGLADRVTFTGQIARPALDELYAKADVFLFPSLRDSGGSGLLEAMEKEVPVVCLDWGGPGEMLEADSGLKVGVFSPEGVVKDLGSFLRELQNNPALGKELAANARRRIAERFSWDKKHALIREIYTRLIRPS